MDICPKRFTQPPNPEEITMSKTKTIIEINGVKLEVDLRQAKRIDELKVGSRVKCLVKKYNEMVTYPGVIVGFEPFTSLPSIVVAYIEGDYSSELKFKTFNAETKDFEVIADLDNNSLEVNKLTILERMDREITKKEVELEELKAKRAFFLTKFDCYFNDTASV